MLKVYIDPWNSKLQDKNFFNLGPIKENRKDSLLPWEYLYNYCLSRGIELKTADQIPSEKSKKKTYLYYSFGQLEGFRKLVGRNDIVFGSFYLFEPPIKLLPRNIDIYHNLEFLKSHFQRIYTTSPISCINEIYKMKYGFDTLLFSYPQSYSNIIECYWGIDKRKFLVMVNSYRYSRLINNEFYSERIKALKFFFKKKNIDLYGDDWDKLSQNIIISLLNAILWGIKWQSLIRVKDFMNSLSFRKELKSTKYSSNKYETLSQYKFALCYESMGIKGFISEKIFECFFVGTIPVFLGAPDIHRYIPENTFIDRRNFKNYDELYLFLINLKEDEREEYRANIKNFLTSDYFKVFSKENFAAVFYENLLHDIKLLGK